MNQQNAIIQIVDDDTRLCALHSGAEAFLNKPIDRTEL